MNGDEDLPRHVLDLPPLHTHPSAVTLLETLQSLTINLGNFEGNNGHVEDESRLLGHADGLPRYLTAIISSKLSWLEDENAKESVWEAASQRLSERSGRSAAPSAHRTFQIPTSASPNSPRLNITLHEPSLTADNLGHKTWAASHLLAKRLPSLLPLLPSLSQPSHNDISTPRVLELGAGTGLLGIAFAALFHRDVHLTDLPPIIPNLSQNIILNSVVLHSHHASGTLAFPLDWASSSVSSSSSSPSPSTLPSYSKYDIILIADPLYSPAHPSLLAGVIDRHLQREPHSRVIVEAPMREGFEHLIEAFRKSMSEKKLVILAEGEESGWDDWGVEGGQVKCWWAVWCWDGDRE